ncbi:MAG: hypothetical protein MdMp014T_1816 [Treponematales bacterium]
MKIYLAKKPDGSVVFHTSLKALKDVDGLDKPDLEVTEEEFSAAGGIARVVKGKIVLGKSAEDLEEEAKAAKVAFLKQQLADSDYIVVKIAEGIATKDDYAAKIAERQKWREEIASLSG